MQWRACGTPLRNAGLVGERIALDDRHAVEVGGEHTRGQQAGHAAADDDGVLGAARRARTIVAGAERRLFAQDRPP